jgi:hypothetical protein
LWSKDTVDAQSAPATVSITVSPVNDAPVVANPIGEVRSPEDGSDVVVDVAVAFADVDIVTSGDSLTFQLVGIDKDNPGLFSSESFTGSTLRLKPAPDQFGTATVTVSATDSQGASVVHTFAVVIEPVNDVPIARNDTVTMVENGGALTIAVLDNDYLAEQPTEIVAAGTDGYSDSDPVTIVDIKGNPIVWPDGSNQNGRITIEGNRVVYEPKNHFHGSDTFTYTIEDADGDESTATVTVTVTPVNDPPEGPRDLTYRMQEGGTLVVSAATGLLASVYDADNARLGADGETGQPDPRDSDDGAQRRATGHRHRHRSLHLHAPDLILRRGVFHLSAHRRRVVQRTGKSCADPGG